MTLNKVELIKRTLFTYSAEPAKKKTQIPKYARVLGGFKLTIVCFILDQFRKRHEIRLVFDSRTHKQHNTLIPRESRG